MTGILMRPLIRLSLCLAAVFTTTALQPGLSAQQRLTKQVEDLVNIDFRNDIRLFAVMSALNAAGFDAETPGRESAWPRTELQSYFRQLGPQVLDPLRIYLQRHRGTTASQTQAMYTSLALTLKGPPNFELALTEDQMPEDARPIGDFAKLLGPFWEQARLAQLWRVYQPRYIQELESYRPVVRQMIHSTLGYFRIPARIVLDRQILLIPDLLNMAGIVNARNLDKTYTIVVGPAETPSSNTDQLLHEYLHFLIDPLVEKHGAVALAHRNLLEVAHQQASFSEQFRDRFLLIVTESLIEALQGRLAPATDAEARLVAQVGRGLVLTPHFQRQLDEFEKNSELSLPESIAPMLEAISMDAVNEDLVEVAKAADRLKSRAAADIAESERERAAIAETNRRRELLNEAGRLLAESRAGESEAKLQELLTVDPDNPQAHFYLGQIASLQNDHERAAELFSKVVANPDAPPDIRGWSLLRLGLFGASQGDFDSARLRFQEVIALEGDLKGAREEAQKRLEQLPPIEPQAALFLSKEGSNLGRWLQISSVPFDRPEASDG